MIQKNWKSSVWVRLINKMIRTRAYTRATCVQKFMRGFLSRNKTMELLKEIHLGANMRYFEAIRKKLMDDSQISIRYAFMKFKKRKAAKKAKKLAAAEAKKGKYGRTGTRKKK